MKTDAEDKTLNMAIKDNLPRLRRNAGLTQEELSTIAGIQKNMVSKLETAITLDPRSSTIVKIAKALRCTVDEILFDDETSGPDKEFRILFERLRHASPKRREMAKELLKSIAMAETQDEISKI